MRMKDKGEQERTAAITAGIWPPQVTVTCTRWQNGAGIGQACLLASATASGLCRIDWVMGRFANDRVPYTSIQAIRAEVGMVADAIDEDE